MHTIRERIIANTVITCVITVLFAGLAVILKTDNIVKREASQKMLYLAREQAGMLDEELKTTQHTVNFMTKLTEQTLNKNKFFALLPIAHRYTEENIPYLNTYQKKVIAPVLASLIDKSPFIQGAYVIFNNELLINKELIGIWFVKDGDRIKSVDNGLSANVIGTGPELEWLNGPRRTGKGFWTPVYEDHDIRVRMISYTEPIYLNKKIVAISGMDISLANLEKAVEKIKIYKTGYATLLGNDHKIVFSKDLKSAKKNYSQNSRVIKSIEQLLKKENSGVIRTKLHNEPYFIAFSHLSNNFILLIEVPISEVMAETTNTNRVIVVILLVILLASVLVSAKIADHIIQPIEKLTGISQKLCEGDYCVNMQISDKADEVSNFVQAFKKFVDMARINQKNESLLNIIFESIVDVLIITDDKGIIVSVNPSIEKVFGYIPSELVGQDVNKLFTCKFFGPSMESCEHSKVIYNNSLERFELNGLRISGESFPVEVGISEISLDDKNLYNLIIRDVTYQKENERIKNEFVSMVSHELRTPLTSIQASLSLITSSVYGQMSEKQEKLANIALTNSQRLNTIINDLLDVEKIEAGKMDFSIEMYNLAEVVRESVELNKGYGHKFNVEIEYSYAGEPIMVAIDKGRIMQVASNLLSNAVKFSHSGDTVTVTLTNSGAMVRVSVVDRGEGIPENFRNKVFQKFSQADSSDSRKKGGTGLGLNICKLIIQKHNGEIDYESEQGKGTTFYFDLPVVYDNAFEG